MSTPFAADLVDLARYPITDLNAPARAAVLARCRDELRRSAVTQLPAFLLPAAVEKLADEARGVAPKAVRRDRARSAYGWMDDQDFAPEHAVGWQHHDRKGTVHYDRYPPTALIRQLYEWQPLTDFIGAALGEERFHICDDPYMSVVLSVMRAGDLQGWHFDTNAYTVTLSLQEPAAGGEFVCAPFVRSEDDERYDQVAALFRDEREAAVVTRIAAGTLTLFRGRESVHRVAAVAGNTDRLMAIFSYHREPGFRWPEAVIRMSKNA